MSTYNSYIALFLIALMMSSCNAYQNLIGSWIVQPTDTEIDYSELKLYKDRSALLLFNDSSSVLKYWQYDQKNKQLVFSDLNSSDRIVFEARSIRNSKLKMKIDSIEDVMLNRSLYIPKLDRTIMYSKLIGVWGMDQRKKKSDYAYSLYPLGQLIAHHPTEEYIGSWSLSTDAKELTLDTKFEQQTFEIKSVEQKKLTLYNQKIKANSQLYRLKFKPKIKYMPLQDQYYLGHWSVKKVGENTIKEDVQSIIFKSDYTYKRFQQNQIVDLGTWSFDPANQILMLNNDDDLFEYNVAKKKKKFLSIRDEHQLIVFQRKKR